MNMMRIFYIGLSGVGMMFSSMASGNDAGGLQSPACGVVCDPYICVNSDGISPELTRKYLGEKAAENLQSLRGYDPSEFTFANGVFCDVKEKLCRDDRYFGVDGKRSGKINQTTTKMLFMCRE
ncbi:YcgJ family protein [Escherichia coli]|nr:YcgJ family protein [Escherichia coli]